MTEATAGSAEAGNSEEGAAPAIAAATEGSTETNWVTSIEDADIRGFAESKGFQDATPADALKSYMNLEKVFGADKSGHTVKMIGEGSTPEEVGEFYTKLGRPEDAAGYELTVPEGADGAFAGAAAEKFHELGLSGKQGTELVDWFNEQAGNVVTTTDADYTAGVETDTAELRKEWGAAYDKNIASAKAAATEFGLDTTQIDAMEKALGFGGLMRHMQNVGAKLGEDINDSTETNQGSTVMTPQQAATEMQKLNADTEWFAAWMDKSNPGHEHAVERKAQLSRYMIGQV